MNKILVMLLVVFICFATLLIVLIIRRINKKKKSIIDIICIVAAVPLCIATVITGFCSVYYHALPEAENALLGNTAVTVTDTHGEYFFDGPGTKDLLIFYPGGKVEYTSYAPLMLNIAESGIDCCIAEMPLNIGFFGIGRADKIMKKYGYERYFIGGHSLGGVSASMYCSGNNEKLSGLILLGSYPEAELNSSLDVLIIYGSEDGCLDMERFKANKSMIHEKISEFCIDGGNHAQFGCYGIQQGDGKASVSPEYQRKVTVEEISEFIQNIE